MQKLQFFSTFAKLFSCLTYVIYGISCSFYAKLSVFLVLGLTASASHLRITANPYLYNIIPTKGSCEVLDYVTFK